MSKDYSYLSVDEFHVDYKKLSSTDLTRIIKVCHYYRSKYQLSVGAEDIFQEVLSRIYAGGRNIPREVKVVTAVISIIKSVAYEILKSNDNKQQQLEEDIVDIEESLHINLHIDNSIEQELMAEREEMLADIRWQSVLDEFNTDYEVTQLLCSIAKGNKAKDIVSKVFDGNQTKYDTTRKRLMRKLAKMQNEGAVQ